MPVNNTTVIPIIWASRLVRRLNDVTVYSARTNRQYQTELYQGGDRVRLSMFDESAVSVGDYTGADITYADLDAAAVGDLRPDKQKYWAVQVDDIKRAQSNPDLVDAAMQVAADKLALEVDMDVRSVMVAGATATDAMTLDHDAEGLSADDFAFSKLNRLMDNAKLPRDSRWVIVGPYSAEVISRVFLKQGAASASTFGEEVMTNGRLGNFAGIDIYVSGDSYSNYTPSTGNSDPDGNNASEVWLAGSDYSTAFIDQVEEVEALRLEKSFKTGIRGLYTYGSRVIEGSTLFKATVSINHIP